MPTTLRTRTPKHAPRHRAEPTSTAAALARRGALAVVAGAAGAAMVVGSAGSASAAPVSEWDRLAQCESGGRWNINTGNGYSGGLQFHPRTWSGFGGGQFAPRAHQATREQQIVVAERVLARQGWRAWPACSRKLGLRGAADPVGAEARLHAPAPAPAPAAPAATRTYTVVPGDTLYRVAVKNGVPGGWRHVYDLNHAEIGPNPGAIRVGQVLRLP
ncbi:LysM domain-containing protein [Kineococcus xinjiangensis]|uniref:LysM domain-containing protein n=1 Tax=Kineococcus xinjiangensis TaxID=512762 RepID=A0A2S6IUV0_9ACTN|nr:transglycosylase family protein [Kineococcus xinjiangensis]PPK97959.1 LysM domain-containing protein [Kineococcus xinjiangensis]